MGFSRQEYCSGLSFPSPGDLRDVGITLRSSALRAGDWLPWWLSWLRRCLQFARPGFDPWVGKTRWTRAWQPPPVLWPREFRGLCGPWGRKESDTTEQLHFSEAEVDVFSEFSCFFSDPNVWFRVFKNTCSQVTLTHQGKILKCRFFSFCLCCVLVAACGLSPPNQLSDLHWEHGVLTTGPQVKTRVFFFNVSELFIFKISCRFLQIVPFIFL